MKKFFAILILSGLSFAATGPEIMAQNPASRKLSGQRKYDLIVNQNNDTLTFNRGLRSLKANGAKLSNRGILSDLAAGYLSLGTSSILSASQNLLGAGVGFAKEAIRDKRPDWEKATMGENRFVKHLPMFTEVLDFYGAPSENGALDPSDMKFSGFGCRQYITLLDDNGNPYDEEVFYLSCSLRDDEHGLARMLNHSKFEVVVDELRFNPYLCNLPNDSLSIDPSTRIGFSFDKRKDLEFKVVATISSSWINEAIQVAKDVELGKFTITAKIDPGQLDDKGVFIYNRDEDKEGRKIVTVTGDSFIVPRSYVGSNDMISPSASWGTGQYKVEMDISESCRINEDYYTESNGKSRRWLKEKWNPEWKLMKKRPKRGKGETSLPDIMFPKFTGDSWITTITEPMITVIMNEEGTLVNAASEKLSTKLGLQPSAVKKPSSTQGATGGQGGAGGQVKK